MRAAAVLLLCLVLSACATTRATTACRLKMWSGRVLSNASDPLLWSDVFLGMD